MKALRADSSSRSLRTYSRGLSISVRVLVYYNEGSRISGTGGTYTLCAVYHIQRVRLHCAPYITYSLYVYTVCRMSAAWSIRVCSACLHTSGSLERRQLLAQLAHLQRSDCFNQYMRRRVWYITYSLHVCVCRIHAAYVQPGVFSLSVYDSACLYTYTTGSTCALCIYSACRYTSEGLQSRQLLAQLAHLQRSQ